MNAALNELGSQLFGWFGQLSIELAALAVLVLSRQSPVADQVAGLAPPVVGGRAAQAARRRRGQLSLYALHAVGTIRGSRLEFPRILTCRASNGASSDFPGNCRK